jgi:orotidine-5'-phosphate decarboxylase
VGTPPVSAHAGFADRLVRAITRAGSPACAGIDPVLERIPAAVRDGCPGPVQAIEAFSLGVIDAVAPTLPAVKLQSACYERYGGAGVDVLARVSARARDLGLVVIVDGKRGDIDVSAAHYAAAADAIGADAVTASAYLGTSSLAPFLDAGIGVFALVRTSNPEGDAVQSARLADGRSVAELVADAIAPLAGRYVGACGYSHLGAVVGLTKAGDARRLRERLPTSYFLVPGYGPQGGSTSDLPAMLDARGAGVLVAASRAVTCPPPGTGDWRADVARAAERFARDVASAVAK